MARPNRGLLEIEAKIAEIKVELDRFQEAARKLEANVRILQLSTGWTWWGSS